MLLQKKISVYVDLSNSDNPDILKDREHFKIFAVPTQVGKIMLINNKTGIAVAIDENPKISEVGRILGTLNGKHSFVQSPNFNLNLGANFLLPSQLSTENFKANGNGTISNYDVLSVDDNKGTITLKATINYLPWFENETSNNVTTTQIIKTFSGLKTIKDLQFEKLNYQLANAQVDFIDANVLESMKLFNLKDNQISNHLKPNLKYSIENMSNSTGKFTVKVNLNKYRTEIDPRSPEQTYNLTYKYKALPVFKNKNDYQIGLLNGCSLKAGLVNKIEVTNLNELPEIQRTILTKIYPSYLAKRKNEVLDLLIDRTKLKGYPLFLVKTRVIANDQAGTLKVELTIPADVNKRLGFKNLKEQTFSTTYTGFPIPNSKISPQFSLNKFNKIATQNHLINVNLSNLKDRDNRSKLGNSLSSQIKIEDLWENIFEHDHFNYSDEFDIALIPDDIKGKLKIFLSKKSNNNFVLFGNNKFLVIEIEGFQKIIPSKYEEKFFNFARPQDQELISLQRIKYASELNLTDLKSLIKMESEIKNQFSNFVLNENNTKWIGNDQTGEVSVTIELPKNPISHNQTQLPKVYQHTFRGFTLNTNSNFNFQPMKMEQLNTKVDLTKITSDYIFANQDEFILRSKGYDLRNKNQIHVNYSEILNIVFISYHFDQQKNLPKNITKHFSFVYHVEPNN